jgi:nucleoside-diphosphate kinase
MHFDSDDSSVEVVDRVTKKCTHFSDSCICLLYVVFLRRTKIPEYTVVSFTNGCKVYVCGRQFRVISYGDEHTVKHFSKLLCKVERTFALIKPDGYYRIGDIISTIQSHGLKIRDLRMMKWTRIDATGFYSEHANKPFFEGLIEFMISDCVVGIEIEGPQAVSQWRTLAGPTNSEEARRVAPESIRAKFGRDKTRNAVHGSDSLASSKRELAWFHGFQSPTTAVLNFCTLVIVKPQAVQRHTGDIISAIQLSNFEISAIRMLDLKLKDAEQFYQVYDGVIPGWEDMCKELASGPLVALEIRGPSIVGPVREIVGPVDPVLAKQVRPNTLRALYGQDLIHNAVHCTDVEDESVRECVFMFAR